MTGINLKWQEDSNSEQVDDVSLFHCMTIQTVKLCLPTSILIKFDHFLT